MSRLIVVRHGDTFAPGDEPRRIGARADLGLVAGGIAQASALGDYLAATGFHFRQVFAAPLVRTRQTAECIAAAFAPSPPITIAEWLTEIDHGTDEGARESVVLARLGPQALAAWDAYAVPPPGWVVDADARLAAWRRLLAARGEGDTLLVTSNGMARFALLALPAAARPPFLKLRTGSFGVLSKSDESSKVRTGWVVERWNVRPPAG